MNRVSEKAGLYVHFPFCLSRCSYCDFVTEIYRDSEFVERYVLALCKEISLFPKELEIDTIYIGGGTPSLLEPFQLEKILKTIESSFSVSWDDVEITVEMNPDSIRLEKLKSFRSFGVNRASFGVQTFDDRLLKILSRRHTAADAVKTFDLLCEAGFENISFDLIAGLPHQTIQGWKIDLDKAISLNPQHLSLYLLEIHEGTPLAEQIRSLRQPQPDEQLSAQMYEIMIDKLEEAGFLQYEISNFSKPGFQSRHNMKYWLCLSVFGFGVSAFSFHDNRRWANERNVKKYIQLIETGNSPIVFEENVDLASEVVLLGLRLTDGIDLENYRKRFGFDLLERFATEIKEFQELGLLEVRDKFLKLTRRGMLYSNEVFAVFV